MASGRPASHEAEEHRRDLGPAALHLRDRQRLAECFGELVRTDNLGDASLRDDEVPLLGGAAHCGAFDDVEASRPRGAVGLPAKLRVRDRISLHELHKLDRALPDDEAMMRQRWMDLSSGLG